MNRPKSFATSRDIYMWLYRSVAIMVMFWSSTALKKVSSLSTRVWCISPRNLITANIMGHQLDDNAFSVPPNISPLKDSREFLL